MTEAELRALVRETIAQHLGAAATTPAGAVQGAPRASLGAGHRGHASHVMFAIASGDSACLIEPAVTCNHCGYCKSYGH